MKSILFLLILTLFTTTSFAKTVNIITCESVFGDSILLAQKGSKFIVTNKTIDGKTAIYKNLRELSAQEIEAEYDGIERVFVNKNESVILGVILEAPEDNTFSSVLVTNGLMAAAKCQNL